MADLSSRSINNEVDSPYGLEIACFSSHHLFRPISSIRLDFGDVAWCAMRMHLAARLLQSVLIWRIMTTAWTLPFNSPSTSLGLLRHAAKKQDEAWTTVTKVYGPLVYAWARRGGMNDTDACDVMQEVFLKTYQRLESYQPARGRFRAWLWTITRNTAIDFQRVRKSQPEQVNPFRLDQQQLSNAQIPCDADSEEIPNEVLRRTLDLIRRKFKEKTFLAAWRLIVLDLNPEDVANGLQMTTAAVYIAKSRVLSELRRILSGFEF